MNGKYNVLKILFKKFIAIQRLTGANVELLPVLNAQVCCQSDLGDVVQSAKDKYTLLMHKGESLYGNHGIISLRHDLYIDGQLNHDKTEIYYVSVPRLILAVLDLVGGKDLSDSNINSINNTELTEAEVNQLCTYISDIMMISYPVSNRNMNYLSALSVNIRHYMTDLSALRQSIKLMVINEQNLFYSLKTEEKFRKSVFLLLDFCEKFLARRYYTN